MSMLRLCLASIGSWPLVAIFLIGFSSPALAAGISLNQCANGGLADGVDHLECYEGWINGNLNQSKAAFAEGDFVPYRVQITGLTIGEEYTYSFSWDTLRSGKHAMDYIGSYDYTVVNADPCDGVAWSCTEPPDELAIPADPNLPFAPTPGSFKLYGGTLTSVGSYFDPPSTTDVRAISVSFTASQANVVLAWGGHISTPIDWGDGNTASDINGSPYHFSNIALVEESTGGTVANGGQDVQLSAAAVFVPSLINITKTSNADGTFSFESDIDGMVLLPVGDVASPWTLARDQSKVIDAMEAGTVTITETPPAGDWRVKSITCSEVGTGEVFGYVNPGSESGPQSATFDVGEASTIDCVFDNEFYGAPVLEVIKKVIAVDETCTDAVRDSEDYETISVRSGEDVRYCLWVTNDGNDKALDVMMEDDLAGRGEPMPIMLNGTNDEGGDDPDLPMGGWVSGELVMEADVPLNTTLLNTATATAIGKTDEQTYMDSDTAEVEVDTQSECQLDASVYTGAGPCPGDSNVAILKDSGTAVNWCANVYWDTGAFLNLEDLLIEVQGESASTSPDPMAPGATNDFEVGSTTPNDDFLGTVVLTGTEGGLNPITCEGMASVNVVDPGLELVKKVRTLDGNCEDTANNLDTADIYAGDPVWWCLIVTNTGDTALESVLIDDGALGLDDYVLEAGELGVGATVWEAFLDNPTADVTNVAYATATEPLTGYQIDPWEMASARVNVLYADVELSKTSDLDDIWYCVPDTWNENCTPQNPDGNYDITYAITVYNNGPDIATGVTVTDTLPAGFVYNSDNAGCLYDGGSHELTCAVGDMDPDGTVVIEVYGEIDLSGFALPWVSISNQACANTTPARLDPYPGNDCDTTHTRVNTGPTRTIGWWSTHPNGIAACLEASEGEIDLGFLTLRTESADNDVDATVSTDSSAKGRHKSNLVTARKLKDLDTEATDAAVMTKGLLNARISSWRDGTKRSLIGQARAQTAKQLTAAWCNEATFGSEFDYYYLGWENIRLIMAGEAFLQGGSVKPCDGPCEAQVNQVIKSIKEIGGVADLFNNAGDHLPNGLPDERAWPKAPQDDPTDPID